MKCFLCNGDMGASHDKSENLCVDHIYYVRHSKLDWLQFYFYYDYGGILFSIVVAKDISIRSVNSKQIIHLPKTKDFKVNDLHHYLDKIIKMKVFL